MDKQQIYDLAPDSSSLAAAKKLESISKWPELKYNERAIWGQCQGSGKNPYFVRIDKNGNAFKCSCPSRKFPCKHGLALYLLYEANKNDFKEDTPPDWVLEWLDSRTEKAEKAKVKSEKPQEIDPKLLAKRILQRELKVASGVDELLLWLEDIMRIGLTELTNKPYAYWDNISARMVDAQTPGLANKIKQISNVAISSNLNLLTELIAELYLLLKAYKNIQILPEDLQIDIKSYIGFTTTEASILNTEPFIDDWYLVGSSTLDEDLITYTAYFYGQNSKKIAKIIQFAHKTQQSKITRFSGNCCYKGAMHFYPSIIPLRAILGEHKIENIPFEIEEIDYDPLENYRKYIVLNPWIINFPIVIKALPILDNNTLYLKTNYGILSVNPKFNANLILALSGGAAITIFAEYDGKTITPLGSFFTNSQDITNYHLFAYNRKIDPMEIKGTDIWKAFVKQTIIGVNSETSHLVPQEIQYNSKENKLETKFLDYLALTYHFLKAGNKGWFQKELISNDVALKDDIPSFSQTTQTIFIDAIDDNQPLLEYCLKILKGKFTVPFPILVEVLTYFQSLSKANQLQLMDLNALIGNRGHWLKDIMVNSNNNLENNETDESLFKAHVLENWSQALNDLKPIFQSKSAKERLSFLNILDSYLDSSSIEWLNTLRSDRSHNVVDFAIKKLLELKDLELTELLKKELIMFNLKQKIMSKELIIEIPDSYAKRWDIFNIKEKIDFVEGNKVGPRAGWVFSLTSLMDPFWILEHCNCSIKDLKNSKYKESLIEGMLKGAYLHKRYELFIQLYLMFKGKDLYDLLLFNLPMPLYSTIFDEYKEHINNILLPSEDELYKIYTKIKNSAKSNSAYKPLIKLVYSYDVIYTFNCLCEIYSALPVNKEGFATKENISYDFYQLIILLLKNIYLSFSFLPFNIHNKEEQLKCLAGDLQKNTSPSFGGYHSEVMKELATYLPLTKKESILDDFNSITTVFASQELSVTLQPDVNLSALQDTYKNMILLNKELNL